MRTVASSNLSRWRLGLNSAFQIASSTVTKVMSTGIGPVLRSQPELAWLQLGTPNADLFDRRNRAIDERTARERTTKSIPPGAERRNGAEKTNAREGLKLLVLWLQGYPFTSKNPIHPSSANSDV
jgi:hypothetical protein